ncbi:MAG: type I restriction endonuclease subunit R [Bacteroidales bacterium]|nr:type I restriction endonuclease subunit R [Bacteroidales bacterium]
MLEKDIENNLINILSSNLKFTYREDIKDRKALEENFRQKFNRHNYVNLTDLEFARLLDEIVTSDVFEASKKLRTINTFMRQDETPLQYSLINTKDVCKNDFEFVTQLKINTRNSFQRYDVVLLINGLPVMQIELKTVDVSPRRAMQQIIDYKNDSGNGYQNTLLCFIQIFAVSNFTNTYYFANNNNKYFNFNAEEQYLPVYQWANRQNERVSRLDNFAESFLKKEKLGVMISRYMVLLETERRILIMRPYQIYAVKAIMKCIEENRGNGYIWHTTGSGKTLTSFKAATLMKDNPNIDKCLFVVDRKDLDKQTRDEFNRFQEKCVEENTNTGELVRRMLSTNYADKIIVCTIQKLGIALDSHYREQLKAIKNQRLVFIFDECHRSQFGENNKAIKEFFPNARLFGFTGTPIFDKNAKTITATGEEARYMTTQDVFQNLLHSYTITDAIRDKNVLRFHVDYFVPADTDFDGNGTIKKQAVVRSVIQKHDAATSQRKFNAIFATSSINDAIEYYNVFEQEQQKNVDENPDYKPLNITCLFSPPAYDNKDIQQIQEDLPNEYRDNHQEPEKKKLALEKIIDDYNRRYSTNHSINEFDSYYQDVQTRIKAQKYPEKDYPHQNKTDITIVVDMLLTGFDSKYLNTLYVDKKLKYHGLVQAFSRTNRILNDSKPYGNILDFRNQQQETDEAIQLFSEGDKETIREVWLVEPAKNILQKYEEKVQDLKKLMSWNEEINTDDIANLNTDGEKVAFIQAFKEVQRLKTQLSQYTDLTEDDKEKIESLIDDNDLCLLRGAYLDTARDLKRSSDTAHKEGKQSELDDIDFEFILFASVVVDYDYIMQLISQYTGYHTKEKLTKDQLIARVRAAANLFDERDDIEEYINTLEVGDGINGKTVQEIKDGYIAFKERKNNAAVAQIAETHGLAIEALKTFIKQILDRMIFDSDKLDDLLAPLNLGWREKAKKENQLMADLAPLLKTLANGKEISGLSAYENIK